VADTALFYDVVSNGGEPAAFSRAASTPPAAPLRIAYSSRIPAGVIGARLDPDCAHALQETVELLRRLGHELVEHDPDYGLDAIPSVVTRYLRGTYDDIQQLTDPARLERRTRGIARMGSLIPARVLERSLSGEAAVSRRVNRVLEEHDVLLTPATAAPPPRIGQLQGRGAAWTLNKAAAMVPYNGPWNLTGQPAASVPAGFGADGLPRAVQLVGRASDEVTLLSLAAQLEGARPWADRRPPEFA
jgi:amidase